MKTKIFLIDQGLGAEFIAAIQSYYSRDPGSAYTHVQKGLVEDPKEFLKKYYKQGYAHKSIAQCTTITLFIEGGSILFAKALQDSPYYNGQEASTRFINFAEQGFANPISDSDIEFCISDIILSAKEGKLEEMLEWLQIPIERKEVVGSENTSTEIESIKEKWMNFYTNNFELVREKVKAKHPIRETQTETQYKTAVYAATCDILRGFLPAGMRTLLSWHTTLDHANDMLKVLKYHPSTEIREVSRGILKALISKYPETFVEETNEKNEAHLELVAKQVSYYEPEKWNIRAGSTEFDLSNFSEGTLRQFKDIIQQRPPKGLAHRILGRAGLIGIKYLMDYGSVRDILRHRPGINQVPLLTTKYGFEKWYIDELPDAIKDRARALIKEQISSIKNLKRMSKYDKQSAISIGFLCPMYHQWPFNQVLYIAELRTGPTVHPTVQRAMRSVAVWVGTEFEYILGEAFYPKIGQTSFSYRRGGQTISINEVEKLK